MRFTIGVFMFILWTLISIFIITLERLHGKHGYENYLKGYWDGEL